MKRMIEVSVCGEVWWPVHRVRNFSYLFDGRVVEIEGDLTHCQALDLIYQLPKISGSKVTDGKSFFHFLNVLGLRFRKVVLRGEVSSEIEELPKVESIRLVIAIS